MTQVCMRHDERLGLLSTHAACASSACNGSLLQYTRDCVRGVCEFAIAEYHELARVSARMLHGERIARARALSLFVSLSLSLSRTDYQLGSEREREREREREKERESLVVRLFFCANLLAYQSACGVNACVCCVRESE